MDGMGKFFEARFISRINKKNWNGVFVPFGWVGIRRILTRDPLYQLVNLKMHPLST